MGSEYEVLYDHRTVDEWVNMAMAGNVALADFQRSFVWEPARAARYMRAIISGRPVGLYLVLNTATPPQFLPRAFSEHETPLNDVRELVLDGQQRLTSLLDVLYGHPKHRFYIEVADWSSESLELRDVLVFSRNSSDAQASPVEDYRNNRVPMDALRRADSEPGTVPPLSRWCSEVAGSIDELKPHESFLIFLGKIDRFVDDCFFQRKIHSCWLPASTTRVEATEIFVETNTSSVRITAFDEQVANIRGGSDQDFRKEIEAAHKSSDVLRHYFPNSPQKLVPKVGEWILKVACLHAGFPPRESNYEHAAKWLFDEDGDTRALPGNLKRVLEDLDWALDRVADRGSPMVSLLPSWPTVHVIAALRTFYEGIRDPGDVNDARKLIDAYYWRCLFSSRYGSQANDRLFQDYRDLKGILLDGARRGADKLRVFSDRHHPLFDGEYLLVNAGWIGSSRLGKALVSAVMAVEPKPVDWVTGDPLGTKNVRQLEGMRKLDRHHVFPKDVLLSSGAAKTETNSGLNAVLLDRRTNRKFWKYPPDEYLEAVLESRKEDKSELRARIAGHFVPFDEMEEKKGPVLKRYRAFLRKRATMMSARIRELGTPPSW